MCPKILPVLILIFSLAMLTTLAGLNVVCGYYTNLWLLEATASVQSKLPDPSSIPTIYGEKT